MKKTLIITSFILTLLLITGCSYEYIEEKVQEEENKKFTLIDDRGYSDEYGFAYYIEGTVRNNTSDTYSYVQIEFNAYDMEGNIVGSCYDNINNLEANGTWKIKAICTGDAKSINNYKFIGFSSW